MPTFAQLQAAYPTQKIEPFFRSLGGEWPSKVSEPSYRNTCAVRLSFALRKAGWTIPPRFREAMQGDGAPLVLKVETMGKLITALFGEATWGMSKQVGAPLKASDLPGHAGIIAYHVAWKDATGHVDLWTGKGFVGSGNLGDVKDGFDIALWRVV